MTDLSHWDITQEFGVFEASALIAGIDPADIGNNWKITMPIHRRMEECYGLALKDYSPNHAPDALLSVAMEKNKVPDKDDSGFEKQKISRKGLARWISEADVKSVYQFDPKQSNKTDASIEANTNSTPAGRWPWGNHHTELLGHLEAAAREFWTGYSPENAKATAPKSETVIAWLEARNVPGQKKKVSNQMATAIASMLRPDDLPTGPRK